MSPLRWFQTGLALMTLFAAGHFFGFLQAARAARTDPQLKELTRAMQQQRSTLLGFSPSILDFREYFSLNFSILLILAAALGWFALRSSGEPLPIVRALAPAYLVAMLALLCSSYRYSVVQGIISCFLIGVCFALAWWRA